ncbi:MAG: hypothetical protein PX634_09555, partial [Microcystis sp. M53600_WE12]|nr:hypothetical protein [Microcystis sp. M53600_WE12]
VIDHLKIGKTLYPTPFTPHPAPTEKLFAAHPNYPLKLPPPPTQLSPCLALPSASITLINPSLPVN